MTKPTREDKLNKIWQDTVEKFSYLQGFKQGQLSQQKEELEFLYLLDSYSGLPPLVRTLIRNKADKIEGEKGK